MFLHIGKYTWIIYMDICIWKHKYTWIYNSEMRIVISSQHCWTHVSFFKKQTLTIVLLQGLSIYMCLFKLLILYCFYSNSLYKQMAKFERKTREIFDSLSYCYSFIHFPNWLISFEVLGRLQYTRASAVRQGPTLGGLWYTTEQTHTQKQTLAKLGSPFNL